MYRIIGADGNPYGPVTVEQLRQWIAEVRVNGQTLVQPDGAADWRPLSSYPELAALLGPAPAAVPPLVVEPTRLQADAAAQVRAPAIGLIVTAVLGIMVALGGLGMHAFGLPVMPGGGRGGEEFERLFEAFAGQVGLVQSLIQLAFGAVVLVGGLKMMKFESYQLAIVSSVMALVPCVSPCCLIGLPVGIWALVVLAKPEVKVLFH